MALIKCPECSNEISDKAPNCPKCGHPSQAAAPLAVAKQYAAPPEASTATKQQQSGSRIVAIVSVGLFLAGCLVFAFRNLHSIQNSGSSGFAGVTPPLTARQPAPLNPMPSSVAGVTPPLTARQSEDTRKRKAAAQRVFQQLLKLSSITEVGVTFPQYSERLLDAKSEIESALLEVDNQGFKARASNTLTAYVDARKFWSNFVGRSGDYRKFLWGEEYKYEQYKLNFDKADNSISRREVTVIWAYADKQLNSLAEDYSELLR